jgi:Arc/MetJ family transcription regulator
MMRTNIVLDEELFQEALKYAQVKTKRELVHLALKEFVENRRRLNLLDLDGKIEFAEGYDYKKLREGR